MNPEHFLPYQRFLPRPKDAKPEGGSSRGGRGGRGGPRGGRGGNFGNRGNIPCSYLNFKFFFLWDCFNKI